MQNITLLVNKFNSIKEKGWIPSVKKGYAGIGLTFEHLIGVVENKFEMPDFNGIELKQREIIANHIQHYSMLHLMVHTSMKLKD